jgi:hypothetical protein
MSDYDKSIHSNPDAQAWAKFFMATVKEKEWRIEDIDEGLMTGWFANAMMAMHDHVKRDRLAQPKQNDEKGRPMTYWGGLASDQPAQSKPEPRKLSHTEIGQLWSEHQEVYAFAKAIESKLTGRAS